MRMTPCMNALDHVARVLCIAGLAFVLVVFWQHKRVRAFALTRAGRAPSRKQFWISAVVAAAALLAFPYFVESCTGFHFPTRARLIATVTMFILFTVWCVFGYFVLLRPRARDPQRSVRRGFVLIAVGGVCFLAALALDWFHR